MKSKMIFEDNFKAWLRSSTNTSVPESVRAFAFNLCELRDGSSLFGVELIGSSEFDNENSDWACHEVWAATPRVLKIPLAFSSNSWKTCLAAVKELVVMTIEGDSAGDVFRTREGIAVGFVDGDLDLVWPR